MLVNVHVVWHVWAGKYLKMHEICVRIFSSNIRGLGCSTSKATIMHSALIEVPTAMPPMNPYSMHSSSTSYSYNSYYSMLLVAFSY